MATVGFWVEEMTWEWYVYGWFEFPRPREEDSDVFSKTFLPAGNASVFLVERNRERSLGVPISQGKKPKKISVKENVKTNGWPEGGTKRHSRPQGTGVADGTITYSACRGPSEKKERISKT